MAILESTKQAKKSQYSDIAIVKKAGGSLLNEKPLFCENGASLIVPSGGAVQLYNVSTGDHVRELFTCDTNIIACQLHPLKPSLIIATTEDGEVVTYDLSSREILFKVKLVLNPDVLNAHKTPKFNVNKKFWGWNDYQTGIDWTEVPLTGLENRKFIYSQVAQYKNGTDLFLWCAWSLADEHQAHISVFSLKIGKHLNYFNMPEIAFKKCFECFGVGLAGSFFVGRGDNFVYICNLSEKLDFIRGEKHMIGFIGVTALAIAPEDTSFATGDGMGRIFVWRNIFQKRPLKTLMHWHTLPVKAVAYSVTSSQIYSGGEENVLVKWFHTNNKSFLPRLSGAITQISMSQGDTPLLSVSTGENRILIMDPNFNRVSVVQHFSKWSTLKADNAIFTIDPRTESFVLSGRTGHIQFLSPQENGRFLYTIDVVNQNVLTNERHCKIKNVEVTHARFSRSGKWMVTVEARQVEKSGDLRLKFWEYSDTDQNFVLNTNIEFPHEGWEVHSLEISSDEIVATTGPDQKFKMWSLFDALNVNQAFKVWSVLWTGSFRQLPCYQIDFSQDSSLIAVSFGPILTIWETSTCSLKCTLSPPLKRDKITNVKFGNTELSHIIVTATESSLFAWNIITLGMIWMVPVKVTALVNDPFSLYMGAFTDNKSLFIFNPSSSTPEARFEKVSNSTVVAANFVFNHDVTHSQLYFINSDQELYCLENADEVNTKSFSAETVKFLTPFAAQVAENVRKDVFKQRKVHHPYRKIGYEHIQTILTAPAHTLPNPSLFCSDVLKSLLFSNETR